VLRRRALPAVLLFVASLLSTVDGGRQTARAVAPSADPVLMAAGDVASCLKPGDDATAKLLAAEPRAAVAMLGDGAYPAGNTDNYQNCYGPTWGQDSIKSRTRTAPGNHEYDLGIPQAADYFAYFGGAAGPSPQGYYSYDLGAWHIIVLNSECWPNGPGGLDGCDAGSTMGRWLADDLARTQARCMVAMWHHPRYFSVAMTRNQTLNYEPSADSTAAAWDTTWRLLQAHGVDVVLNGHRHVYERFPKLAAPQGGHGGFGVPDEHGIREFIVGTGGGPHELFQRDANGDIVRDDPNSSPRNGGARIDGNWGVLRLTLHQSTYDWQFQSAGTPGTGEAPAGTVLDSGQDTCRDDATPTPTTAPAPSPTPTPTPTTAGPTGTMTPPAAAHSGYWMVGSDGKVYAFGDAKGRGDAQVPPGVEATDLEPTPSGAGYWLVDSRGTVSSFGDARPLGQLDPTRLAAGERVTSLSATPTGQGLWLFTTKGRVFNFGDAAHFGDLTGVALNGPVLDSIPTATGRGYYMVASDGGIFAFGDATFYGSMGNKRLNAPVQSLVPDSTGAGYWLVASDGGIFAFGDAPFRGSMGSVRLNRPVTGMVRYGTGYLMVGEDGGIFNFSDRDFAGSLGADPPAHPIVSVAALG
jgi:Calcineurin-like phosphoesterase